MSKPSSKKKKAAKKKKATKKNPAVKTPSGNAPKIHDDKSPKQKETVVGELPNGVELDPNASAEDNQLKLTHAQITQFLGEVVGSGDYLIFGVRRNAAGNMHPFEFTALGLKDPLPASNYIDAVAMSNAVLHLRTLSIANDVLVPHAAKAGTTTDITEVLSIVDGHTDRYVEIMQQNGAKAKTSEEVDAILAEKDAVIDSKKTLRVSGTEGAENGEENKEAEKPQD